MRKSIFSTINKNGFFISAEEEKERQMKTDTVRLCINRSLIIAMIILSILDCFGKALKCAYT